MNNLERYKKVFIDCFEIEEAILTDLKYQDIDQWDSLGHMSMIGALEDEFDIMFEMDDIIDFSSFIKGKETLAKYGIDMSKVLDIVSKNNPNNIAIIKNNFSKTYRNYMKI